MEIYRLVYCMRSVVAVLFKHSFLYTMFIKSLQRPLFVFKEEYANFVKMYATFNIRVNKYKH